VHSRSDDVVVLVALIAVAIAVVSFRYLPMVDLPQHYAMVSIMRHHAEPAWGFAHRYTFDFVGRPYATVYWIATALAYLMPLAAAMRIVVAICTVAPFAGLWALLAALDRPRAPLLFVLPFAFGSLWHWGFLNFLLGTGLFLAGLALVVVAARRDDRRAMWALLCLGPLLLLTHFHGLVMLLMFAPVFAAAVGDDVRRSLIRAVAPLSVAAILAAAFVLLTWRQAEGAWDRMSPSLGERIARFEEFLGGGLPEPWPAAFAAIIASVVVVAFFLEPAPTPRRWTGAFAFAFAAQVVLYLVLPLNTNTATYVSARHALLIALFAVLVLPVPTARWHRPLRVAAAAVAALGIFIGVRHLACFDREARDFDPILERVGSNRRILPLIFDRYGACVPRTTFPYLHFAAYAQAAHGGELSRSFAVVWNVPIRYRADYVRYPIREMLEWAPNQVSAEDIAHFDLVIARGTPRLPPDVPLREVARSGAWTLFETAAK
jgi:hypothetical protein